MQKKLTIVLAADLSQFDKDMLAASKRIKNLGKDVQNFGKKVLALGNIMKARGASAPLSAVKIQDAFKTIRAGTGATGVTGEKPRGLQDEFKKLARTVPESNGETATAIADLDTGPGLSGQSLRKTGRAMPDVTGSIKLPEGVALVMPGDNSPFEVELMAPVAMNEQLRFAIREGGHTVGAGVVLQSLH